MIWLYTSIWAMTKAFSNTKFVLDKFTNFCVVDFFTKDKSSIKLFKLHAIVGFFIPLFIIIVFNCLIYKHIRSRTRFHVNHLYLSSLSRMPSESKSLKVEIDDKMTSFNTRISCSCEDQYESIKSLGSSRKLSQISKRHKVINVF